jgi:hypothetical protein
VLPLLSITSGAFGPHFLCEDAIEHMAESWIFIFDTKQGRGTFNSPERAVTQVMAQASDLDALHICISNAKSLLVSQVCHQFFGEVCYP